MQRNRRQSSWLTYAAVITTIACATGGVSLVDAFGDSATHAEGCLGGGAAVYVTLVAGRLTVEANAAELATVLTEISCRSRIHFHGGDLPQRRVTVSFRNIPIEAALKRLVESDFNLLLIYDSMAIRDGANGLSDVWLFPVRPEQRMDVASIADSEGLERARDAENVDLQQRLDAIRTLADVDARVAGPRVLEAIDDNHPEIRRAAVVILGNVGDIAGVEPLARRLITDPDPGIREAAAHALGRLRLVEGLGALRDGLRDPDKHVRAGVVDALGDIADDEAERLLRLALHDSENSVREAAHEVLARFRRRPN
jgi:hypothetical protein